MGFVQVRFFLCTRKVSRCWTVRVAYFLENNDSLLVKRQYEAPCSQRKVAAKTMLQNWLETKVALKGTGKSVENEITIMCDTTWALGWLTDSAHILNTSTILEHTPSMPFTHVLCLEDNSNQVLVASPFFMPYFSLWPTHNSVGIRPLVLGMALYGSSTHNRMCIHTWTRHTTQRLLDVVYSICITIMIML